MKSRNFKLTILAFGIIITSGMLQSCGQPTASSQNSNAEIDSLREIVLQLAASNDSIATHLKTFDELDFDVFSNQKWDRLKESHAKDIKVYWPDGHMAQGI